MGRGNCFNHLFVFAVLATFNFLVGCRSEGQGKEQHQFTNALIDETSPYLLQHAHNPVDWQPWSEAALKKAREENKLVLVSIGYSSCHWCHVMEKETFVDESVAKVMNENFVNIKVDREERPDLDQVYMTAVQLMTGDGGWPLNVILLPNGKPLYGGTYHTKEDWKKVLLEISKLFNENPGRAYEYGDKVAQGVRAVNIIEPPDSENKFSVLQVEDAVRQWKLRWDREWGGNKERQKFMMPGNLCFLLSFTQLNGDVEAREQLKLTLDKMALGGVYDQLGGGFFRYSTDPYWKIPHFEKMLYDNAQLIGLYSKAYAEFKTPLYREVVFETFSFLKREMANRRGAFFAALDADTEEGEGAFYLWEKEELELAISENHELFAAYYNLGDEQAREGDEFVLHRPLNDPEFAGEHGLTTDSLEGFKKRWKENLMEKRGEKTRPGVDDKILTSWNALLISGLIDAYKVFGTKEFLTEAETTYNYLLENSYKEGVLQHSYKRGSKQLPGFLEDYAFLANAAFDLYTATMKPEYLEVTEALIGKVMSGYQDGNTPLYRYNESNELISRIVKIDDGVIPSPNAVLAELFFKLGHLKYEKELLQRSGSMLNTVLPRVTQSLDNYSRWGSLLINQVYPYYEVAVVGDTAAQSLLELHSYPIPNALIVGAEEESTLPLFENRWVPGTTFIYVCRNNSCKLPVRSTSEALRQLSEFGANPVP